MKLFQQLLVAPAALGLMAPMAANAADLDIKGVSDYSASSEQVTSISQFQDVYPTDWAYQALSNLIERYGCVAGYPSGSYLGNRAMTRFEAAALLNACLDRITEVTDELRRLLKEFEQELAILKGRVDGLEARVGELEATQFSTTTKLKGKSIFVLGAVNAGGDESLSDPYNEEVGAFTFTYDLRLGLNTSFTGKDLLYTRLRSGNMDSTAWEGEGLKGSLTALDTASATGDIVTIDRLYYRFPVGDEFTFIAGPLARNTEMLGIKPTAYGKSKVLDYFGGTMGTPGVYNKETGGAFGAIWKQKTSKGDPAFSASVSYVSDAGEANDGNPSTGGFMTDNAEGNITGQLAYSSKRWGVALGYRYGQCGVKFRRGTDFVADNKWHQNCQQVVGFDADGDEVFDQRSGAYSNNFAVNAFWKPEDSGWIPSVSAGWGLSGLSGDFYDLADNDLEDDLEDQVADQFQSWMVGLQWSDVFIEGNYLGLAGGQPQFVTSLKGDETTYDGNYAFELWYKFQVTDNISITPAVFYLSRPMGQNTGDQYDNQFNVFGGVVQTTFKF